MQHRNPGLILLVALGAACSDVVEPKAERTDTASFVAMQSSQAMPASGTFSQTAITSLDVRAAGPNTFMHQTSAGSVTGTLSGTYEDVLTVVIHPNGHFNARFTITCQCTVDGETGVLHLVANDIGQLVSPTVASFAGRAVITGATGDLAGLRGVLQIAGTVDLLSGLSTYSYSGTVR
jgi:hypothetical protein